MRQTSQISKLTSLRAGLAAFSIVALIGISGTVFAADAAPAAEAKASVPGKPKVDAAVGETLYSNGDATRGVTVCLACHGPK